MDVAPYLDHIRGASSTEDKDKALCRILEVFLDPKNEDDTDDIANEFVDKGLLDDLYTVLENKQLYTKVGQVLAEVAKSESVREPCVEKGFVPIFLGVLNKDENVECVLQSCRALGNMCFDNDMGRNKVDEHDGIQTLLTLLRSLLSNSEEGSDKLRTVACGFLLNLTNTHEVLQQKAIEGGALDVVEQYLQHYKVEEGLCNMVLVTIGSLTDSEICKEKLLTSSLCSTLVEFLSSPNCNLHYEAVLDILINLSEWDEVKDLLARTDLCNHLIAMAQVPINDDYSEENQTKVKLASDLLILLLTGERSMEVLFDNGKGSIFQESLKWLDSKYEHLQLSGALALGNFARSDEHCKFLIEQGVVEKLLVLMKPVYGEAKCTLEHAALSALRNLAIPAINKPVLIKAGVIDAVLTLVDSEMFAVIFKMLGVLRMLVDGQEEAALRLGQDREFMTRLVEWCAVEEHPGVKGEATRLLAWIIKNGRSEEIMRQVIRADGIPFLVAMATSEHLVMQNEALVSLTLIAATVLADAAVQLKESELTETILELLKNERTVPEILCNTLTLTRTICSAADAAVQLKESELTETILELLKNERTVPEILCNTLTLTRTICSAADAAVQLKESELTETILELLKNERAVPEILCNTLTLTRTICSADNLREELVGSGITEVIKLLTTHDDEKVREDAKSLEKYIEELTVER